jgi:hypothetical protein
VDLTVIPARGRGLFSNRRYHLEDRTFVVCVDTSGGTSAATVGKSKKMPTRCPCTTVPAGRELLVTWRNFRSYSRISANWLLGDRLLFYGHRATCRGPRLSGWLYIMLSACHATLFFGAPLMQY